MRVAFIGLGVMGYHMAAHLAAKGHQVTVYNRTASKAEQWVAAFGGKSAATRRWPPGTPKWSAPAWATTMTCARCSPAPMALSARRRQAVLFVDHATASANVARELYAAAGEQGLALCRCAGVGRRSRRARGHPDHHVRRRRGLCSPQIEPVLGAYARAVTRIGGAGAGQLAKMVNQICIAGLLQGLSEAIAFGERAGLDMKVVLDVISKGAAGSVATGKSRPHHDRRQVRLRLRGGTGCARILASAWTQRAATAPACPSRLWSTSSTRTCSEDGCGRADTSALIKRLR
ncbi:NAD(P)-dependent oxidoreductase [Cupriavidus basilensis]